MPRDTVSRVNKLSRCPFCGALNPVEADWCGQCLARFTEPGVEYGTADDGTGDDEEEDEEGEPPASGTTAVRAAPGTILERGAFRVTDEGIHWVCPQCETVNSIDDDLCVACSVPFAQTLRVERERPTKDPGTAALFSLFFPGAGHAYLGLWGQAATRAILSTWAILVAIFSIFEGTGAGSVLLAGLFIVSALALWVVAAHDAYREASLQEERVLLHGRRYLWVVIGLLMSMVTVLTIAGVSASR
jgi:ribosomal protein L40E/TM2 domain-containing membrane protein YozV